MGIRKCILLTLVLFFGFNFVMPIKAAPIIPYVNCGIAGGEANRCCFPRSTNSDEVLGDTKFGGIISGFVINKAITMTKSALFEWIPGLFADVFDVDIDRSKNLDAKKTDQEIVAESIKSFCSTGEPVNKDDPQADISTLSKNNCICQVPPNTFAGQFGVNDADTTPLGRRCNKMTNDQEKSACLSCLNSINTTGKAKVWTAIGCIDLDLQDFMTKFVFTTLLGLAGILSLGCLIYWAIKLEYSGASADVQKKAREGIRQCLMGLILIIFSIFIIRLIGVDILSLPGIQ